MSNIPADLSYTETHEWVRVEADGTVTVGITDHAQEALGDLVYIELPAVGAQVAARKEIIVVESVKAASDVYAPLAGTITAVNESLADAPEALNQDAYGSWLVRLKPDNPGDLERLLDAATYRNSVEGH